MGLVIVGVIAVEGQFGLGFSQGVTGKALAGSAPSAGAPAASVAPGNPAPNIPHTLFISPEENQRLRADREAAMRANPDLVAEETEISREIQAQLAKMDAAAIKADPKVAPILAKLAALHHPNSPHALPSAPAPR